MKPPTIIYLQIQEFPDTTWCVDQINDDDVEYVIASQRDELAAACRNTVDNCTTCYHGAIYGDILEDGPDTSCPICFQAIQALAALDQEARS